MKIFFSFFSLFLFLLFPVSAYSQNNSSNISDNSFLLQKTPLSIWDVQLNINVTGTYGIYDGTFFYVTDGFSNVIKVYDVNGNLLYNTAAPVTGLKDLAFDGTFEYGGTAGNTIYQMNFQTGTLIGTISSPVAVRYIAYDSDNDAFWVGNAIDNSITLVSRSGTVLGSINLGLQPPSISGIAYDGESPDGPYLWLFTSGTPGPLLLYQLSTATGTLTGVTHNVSDDIGIGQPNAISGGLFFTNQFISNTCSLGGVLVGDPTKLFLYEICNSVPVELVSFTADIDEDGVKLNWSTSTETNNYGFEIQKTEVSSQSAEGGISPTGEQLAVSNWEEIGFVNGNGTTTHQHNYSFFDKNIPSGDYLYRLKQIDFDGSFEFSKTINITYQQPGIFKLEQNYPNPFNPVTTIKYSVPVVGTSLMKFVRLKVYDPLGKEVAVLVDEVKPAGEYEVIFDASGLSSGIYFYRLQAGSSVQTRKMIVLR